MPNANDLRRTLTDPTPLYFAAGVLDKIREEAPSRIAAVRETDPKEVQAKVAQQAKETQAKVSETLGGIDTDIKKLREQAQHLALQGVGFAAEYAVKAREAYDELAVRGREAVQSWRGEESGETPQVTVERESVKVAEPPVEDPKSTTGTTGTTGTSGAAKTGAGSGVGAGSGSGAAKQTSAASSSSSSTTTKKTGTGNGSSASTTSTGTGTARKNTTAGKSTTAKKTTPKSQS